jgi:hypothetical protein
MLRHDGDKAPRRRSIAAWVPAGIDAVPSAGGAPARSRLSSITNNGLPPVCRRRAAAREPSGGFPDACSTSAATPVVLKPASGTV